MFRKMFAVLVIFLSSTFSFANPEKLPRVSVMITHGEGSGSGVAFRNGEKTFIWTAAHVVSPLQYFEEVDKKKTSFFKKLSLVQPVIKNNEHFADRVTGGRVIRFYEKEDIALVEVNNKDFLLKGVRFTPKSFAPKLGSNVWHVGSAGGYDGINSLLKGHISFVGRNKNNYSHDQIQIPATWGCSGGGVFNDDGDCVGLITEFLKTWDTTPGIFMMTPTRRLWEFSQRNDCLWAMDSDVEVPATIGLVTEVYKEMPLSK